MANTNTAIISSSLDHLGEVCPGNICNICLRQDDVRTGISVIYVCLGILVDDKK